MVTKTAVLNEETHKYLKTVQSILYVKYNIEMYIPDIIYNIIQDDSIKDAERMAEKIAEKISDVLTKK